MKLCMQMTLPGGHITNDVVDSDIIAGNDPVVKAFVESSHIVEITLRSSGSAFVPITYTKIEGELHERHKAIMGFTNQNLSSS